MKIQTKHERNALRKSGALLNQVMQNVLSAAVPGAQTYDLEMQARADIDATGGMAAFYRYRTGGNEYPCALCISINDEVVHGIHGTRETSITLKEGDIVTFDAGLSFDGFYTDMARTVIIGDVAEEGAQKLVSTAKEALDIGISAVRAGIPIREYGAAVEQFVEAQGFHIVRALVGHGVGRAVHEPPEIPNWDNKDADTLFEEGDVVALEPMITEKKSSVAADADGWTWRTTDGSRAAHFEDTIIVTKNGAEIITRL